MKFENYMILEFPSKSSNEAFARSAVACFASQMDPTLEELGDIRTAVSEAVTNCIVHAYPNELGMIMLRCRILKDNVLDIVVKDKEEAQKNPEVLKAVEEVTKSLGGDGRILLRASGTEPKIRVMVEAKSDELCEQNVDKVIAVIKEQGLIAD